MPWMLLNPDPAESQLREKPERQPESPPAGPARREPPAQPCKDTSQGRVAWVLLGDLDAALYQSGVVGVWLERLPAPSEIFAGGLSALNAVLACEHDPLAFRIGWERVRAAHVLADAAVRSSILLRYVRDGSHEPIDAGRLLQRAATRRNSSTLHLLVGGAFADVATGAEQSLVSLIEETLKLDPSVTALATAIDAAVTRRCVRILVPGIEERRIGEREVARAIEDARAHGVEVIFLPLSTRQRPGVIGYLLPGLGRADRLLRDGRRAALRWLAASGDSPGAAGVAA